MKQKLVAEKVFKVFHRADGTVIEILNDINITVNENELLVILGPGHCGKTVFLKLVAGLDTPSAGKILMDGQPVTGPSPTRGMVFQKYALMQWKTVIENVGLGLKLNGVSRSERNDKAERFIKLVGLSGFERAYPDQLSGGMKQRVGIARAYCTDPEVLLMDEPFGALDAQTRYQMEGEVLRIWEEDKRTVIFVTNNIEEAIYLGDRIVLLSKCPAHVKAEYEIDLPRPRAFTDPLFLELRHRIADNSDLAL
jgi:NitT/TauT family transport system ATP-binding protein/sulfonate transport system ATP-binding protein